MKYSEYPWPMKNPDHRPFSHQKETVEFLLRNKRSYVLSDIGTGKTLCPLWMADLLLFNDRIKKVLIVTPLSTMRSVWAREIFENFPYRKYAIAHGSYEKRVAAIRSNADFVIINHDGIKSVEDVIIREQFDIMVIDELTAYKNFTADRSKCIRRISKSCTSVIGMTGKPTPNSPSEAFGQAHVINPTNPFLPRYFGKFRSMVEVEIAPYTWIPKPDAKHIVHQVLQPAIRFERDKCLDLPPVTFRDVEVDFTAEQKHAYKEMKDELLLEYAEGSITAVNAAVKISKLLQIAAGSVRMDDGTVRHLDCSIRDNWLHEFYEESGCDKLIIVSAFRASVERLTEFFKSKKIKTEYIHGNVSSNRRTDIINAFQFGDQQILVAQPQAIAHGITLTSSCNIVWQSLVPSGEVYTQMNGRITRAGQKRKQYVTHLLGCAAERRMLGIVNGKENFSKAVNDMFVHEEF